MPDLEYLGPVQVGPKAIATKDMIVVGSGGPAPLYVQPTTPTFTANGLWIDTSGGNLNFWVETGF